MSQHTFGSPTQRLQECPSCAGFPVGEHRCGFLAGVFDEQNWRCGVLSDLWRRAEKFSGSEVETGVVEGARGEVVVLVQRVGAPQRVRRAWVVSARLEVLPLTMALAVELLTQPE
jgi:hypothetical protein